MHFYQNAEHGISCYFIVEGGVKPGLVYIDTVNGTTKTILRNTGYSYVVYFNNKIRVDAHLPARIS